jgi:hypothetical protein
VSASHSGSHITGGTHVTAVPRPGYPGGIPYGHTNGYGYGYGYGHYPYYGYGYHPYYGYYGYGYPYYGGWSFGIGIGYGYGYPYPYYYGSPYYYSPYYYPYPYSGGYYAPYYGGPSAGMEYQGGGDPNANQGGAYPGEGAPPPAGNPQGEGYGGQAPPPGYGGGQTPPQGYGQQGPPPGYGGAGENYGYQDHRPGGGIRLMVDPTDAQVLVDGRYAGVVEDFNGTSKHLLVGPGRHQITLKKEGYKTHTFQVYVQPGSFLKVRYDMVSGSGEDPGDTISRSTTPPPKVMAQGPRVGPSDQAIEVTAGLTSVNVQPKDATIYVDGEYRGSARDITSLKLEEGSHRVEVMRPGYKTVTRQLEVATDAPSSILVSLERP